jgi:hypothetical protein
MSIASTQRINSVLGHLNNSRGSPAHLSPSQTSAGKKFTVAVLGAAGGIGQPLSLLMKLDPLVGDLRW